jgi:hypothetical protein
MSEHISKLDLTSYKERMKFYTDPKNWEYSIEPHGNGYALYHGRTPFTHGANLAHITVIDQQTIGIIVNALNNKS